VFAYAAAEGVQLRLDGTETQVRRPRANRAGRRAFVSGKKKQNTIKTTTVSDGHGRTLWAGAVRPGRMHDQTAVKPEGIQDLLRQHPTVTATVDAGYQGLAKAFGDQVHAPPPKPSKTRQPSRSASTRRHASNSPRGGSASSMPSPSPSSGAPCSAGSDAATTTPRPTWPSPGWSLTGPPAADHPTHQPDLSDQHASAPIAHQVVSLDPGLRQRSPRSPSTARCPGGRQGSQPARYPSPTRSMQLKSVQPPGGR
jgi:DDE superfamily endonuclease